MTRLTTTTVSDPRPSSRCGSTAFFQPAYPACTRLGADLRLPGAVHLPVGAQACPDVGPEADRQARGVGGAQAGRLGHLGPNDLGAQDVGLKLHQEIVDGGAAVDLEPLQRHAAVGVHGLQHFTRLVADRFQRGAHDVGPVDVAGQADDDAAGVAAPVGGEESAEGRHEIAAAAVVARCRAMASVSAAFSIRPRLSRSHCTVAPAMAIEPSSA